MPPKTANKLVKSTALTAGEKKKLKNDNKAKANPGKAADKKEKNDAKRERRYVHFSNRKTGIPNRRTGTICCGSWECAVMVLLFQIGRVVRFCFFLGSLQGFFIASSFASIFGGVPNSHTCCTLLALFAFSLSQGRVRKCQKARITLTSAPRVCFCVERRLNVHNDARQKDKKSGA
jgi:hypothetical protein